MLKTTFKQLINLTDNLAHLLKFIFMKKHLLAFLLIVVFVRTNVAQNKIILDSKVLNGICTDYFDLGRYGFLLQYTKTQNPETERDKKSQKLSATYYYLSKDLSKRATIKAQVAPNVRAFANELYLLIIDEYNSNLTAQIFDYTGKKIITHVINLNNFGLATGQVSRFFFNDNNRIMLEIIDVKDNTHLFYVDALEKNAEFKEADIPWSSSNPLSKMNYTTSWKFLQESKGYYIMYRMGTNAEYGATSASCHLAFYTTDFILHRELLIDNILNADQNMISKSFDIVVNPVTQQVVTSTLINSNNKPYVLAAAYGLDNNSVLMKLLWRHELDIIQSAKYNLIDLNGADAPPAPVIICNGKNNYIMVFKNTGSIAEERLNQFICINSLGQVTYNKLQKGNLEFLNLDAYCVDADNMYDRIYQLKLNSTLKPMCEEVNIEALDIYIDDAGNELAVLKDNSKKQVTVLYYKAQ